MQAFLIGDSAYTILRCLNINREKENFSTGCDRGPCVYKLEFSGNSLNDKSFDRESVTYLLCFNKAEHSSPPN